MANLLSNSFTFFSSYKTSNNEHVQKVIQIFDNTSRSLSWHNFRHGYEQLNLLAQTPEAIIIQIEDISGRLLISQPIQSGTNTIDMMHWYRVCICTGYWKATG